MMGVSVYSIAAGTLLLGSLPFALAQASYNGGSMQGNDTLPVVDLGYNLQRANSYNATAGYYNFSNIRFAAPPTGGNRWRVPQSPAVNRSVVQTGEIDRICPQGDPTWQAIGSQYVPVYLKTGRTDWTPSDFNLSSSTPAVEDPRATEDCLFLDVIVPDDIFCNAGKGYGAPVLVWIFGGGYVLGSKANVGTPAGLLRRAENNNGRGIIYVAMNYRLGAFGWLSGPTFQQNGTANLGLYDQRAALEWVQKHIAKFGGDPNRVTVMGESAGGGSIMHQITAWGGKNGKAPFQQAIPQSPGWQPMVSNRQQEQTFQDYLRLLNVSTLAEARKLPYSALQKANVAQVANSAYGQFTYGPTVDGDFAPKQPGELLLHGEFDKSVRVMVGHNGDEGLLFTTPYAQNDTAFANLVTTLLPTLRAWPEVLDHVTNTMYPPIFNGSQAQHYKDSIGRAAAFVSELIFTCNTYYLNKAYNNQTYAYYFTVPPATHGQDNPYFFYDHPSPQINSTSLAMSMQEYVTSFTMKGNPNEQGLPFFGFTGRNSTVQQFNLSGVSMTRDPTANQRCDFWQQALYV